MWEEFLRQAREFDQSLWGQLFHFLGGVFMVGMGVGWWFIIPSRYKLWPTLLGFLAAVSWDIGFFLRGQLLRGGMLALIILASVALIASAEIRRRKLNKS
ncbi:MAG: hypothetical protein QXI60_05420 [Thermofilaceae archaeon]